MLLALPLLHPLRDDARRRTIRRSRSPDTEDFAPRYRTSSLRCALEERNVAVVVVPNAPNRNVLFYGRGSAWSAVTPSIATYACELIVASSSPQGWIETIVTSGRADGDTG
jgi:hypothetical protein